MIPDPGEFDQHRSALFGLAYRMLGTVGDAEDIVQDASIRWQTVSRTDIRSPRAYLMTMVTRLCVDQLRLLRIQRESYIGEWLPEPLFQSPDSDPAHQVELHESISTAFLVLLENLTPLDRAVFLLHEVFNYTFTEIAVIVDRTPADCRQIGHRARQRLLQERPRFEVRTEAVEKVVQQFLRACKGGDIAALLALLAPDVTVTNDNGGKVRSVRNTVVGQDKAARMFLGIFHRWSPPVIFHIEIVNGQPALIGYAHEHPVSVTTFDVRDDKINAIYQVLNPDKLRSPASDAKPGTHES